MEGDQNDMDPKRDISLPPKDTQARIPNPPSNLPHGPYASKSEGNKLGSFQGPPQTKGPRSQAQYVPKEGEGGPKGSKGYWKLQVPGEKVGKDSIKRAGLCLQTKLTRIRLKVSLCQNRSLRPFSESYCTAQV